MTRDKKPLRILVAAFREARQRLKTTTTGE